MKVTELIEKIKSDSECEVYDRTDNTIKIASHLILPDDLKEFYKTCRGMSLFTNNDYSWEILAPDQLKSTCIEVLGEEVDEDIVSGFLTLVSDSNGNYLSINCNANDNGIVVDSFRETFGLADETPVIALSYTELLEKLYLNKGEYPYWLEDPSQIHRDLFENYEEPEV